MRPSGLNHMGGGNSQKAPHTHNSFSAYPEAGMCSLLVHFHSNISMLEHEAVTVR